MKKREVKTTVFASRFSLFRAADCRPCGIPGRAGIAASGCAVARNDRGGRPCGVPAMPVGEGLAPPAGTRVSKQKRLRANAHSSAHSPGALCLSVRPLRAALSAAGGASPLLPACGEGGNERPELAGRRKTKPRSRSFGSGAETFHTGQIWYFSTLSGRVAGSAERLMTKLIFSCSENLFSQVRKSTSASGDLSLTSL